MDVNAQEKLAWSDSKDRELIGLDLMAQGRLLAMDWLIAGSAEEKNALKEKVVRVMVRLAAIEVADCREELRLRRRRGARNDQLVIRTLGLLTDALEAAHADLLSGGDGKAYLFQAVAAAETLRLDGLLGWFRYGPCAGLLLVAEAVIEQECFDFGVIDDLQMLTWCAKEIAFSEEPLAGGEGSASFAATYRGFKKGAGAG